jgi:hypothetical protein
MAASGSGAELDISPAYTGSVPGRQVASGIGGHRDGRRRRMT